MSNYLSRLKEIENNENFNISSENELTKPPKDTSVSFDSTTQAEIEKNSNVLVSESIEIKMIRAWLIRIQEPEEDHFIVINKCLSDPAAAQYFLKHAQGGFDE